MESSTAEQKLGAVRLLGLDVDGVLTDGGILMGSAKPPTGSGEMQEHFTCDLRRFDSRDGVGIKLLERAGIRVAVISGRRSLAVEQRCAELGIEDVIQGTIRKVAAMKSLLKLHGLQPHEAAFVGDDLPDLPLMEFVGVGFAVADACPEVIDGADIVLRHGGGRGAVREAAEYILKAQGRWDAMLRVLRSESDKDD